MRNTWPTAPRRRVAVGGAQRRHAAAQQGVQRDHPARPAVLAAHAPRRFLRDHQRPGRPLPLRHRAPQHRDLHPLLLRGPGARAPLRGFPTRFAHAILMVEPWPSLSH